MEVGGGSFVGLVSRPFLGRPYVASMPDWKKRVSKERSEDLNGEPLVGATFFQGRGTLMGQLVFATVREFGHKADQGASVAIAAASVAGVNAKERGSQGYNTFDGSVAAQFPDDKGVLAFTDRRLIVFGYSQGMFKTKITDVVASVPLEQMVGWSYQSSKVSSVLNMAFKDGSDVGIELPRANKPDEFAAELGIPAVE